MQRLAAYGAQYAVRAGADAAGRYVRRRLAERGSGGVYKTGLGRGRGSVRPVPTPPSRPSRPPAPPRRIVRRNTYRTRGHRGRKFSNKISKKLNKYLSRGVVIKRESGFVVSDADVVYVGHNSLPVRQMLRAVFLSIGRMFALKVGENFSSFDTQLQGDQPTAVASGYAWRVNFRRETGGAVLATTYTSGGGESWGAFSINLLNLICAAMNNAGVLSNYFEVVDIGLIDSSLSGATATQHYSADEIMLEVVGNSNMTLQNRTVASTTAGDTDNDQANHVAQNPLTGKRYTGYGPVFPFRFNQDFTAAAPMFQTDANDGSMSIGLSTTLSTLPSTMLNVLRKPPPFSTWHHTIGNWYESLKPGQIRRSKVKTYKMIKLSTLLQKYLFVMRTGTTVDALVQDTMQTALIGKTNFFGFEKLCNSRVDEPSVSIGAEINVTISCCATPRRKLYCAPLVTVS